MCFSRERGVCFTEGIFGCLTSPVGKLDWFPVAVRAQVGNPLHDWEVVSGALSIRDLDIKKEGSVGGPAGPRGEPVLGVKEGPFL